MALTKGQQLTTWLLGTIVATGAAGTYLFNAFSGIVTEAKAQAIADAGDRILIAQLTAIDVKRERGELKAQLEIARLRISYLNGKSARTVDEDEELRTMRATVDRINLRLEQLDNSGGS